MKEDLRVQKTKTALFRAFYELLSEKSYESITVNELCERATVRRATFYKHYRDKQDFLVGIVTRFRESFNDIIRDEENVMSLKDYFAKYLEIVLDKISKHPRIARNILTSQMRDPFINVVIQTNFKETVSKLEEAVMNGAKLTVCPEVAASAIVGGVSLLLVHWFENGMTTPHDVLITDVRKVIEGIIES